jgi:hypothetical protein
LEYSACLSKEALHHHLGRLGVVLSLHRQASTSPEPFPAEAKAQAFLRSQQERLQVVLQHVGQEVTYHFRGNTGGSQGSGEALPQPLAQLRGGGVLPGWLCLPARMQIGQGDAVVLRVLVQVGGGKSRAVAQELLLALEPRKIDSDAPSAGQGDYRLSKGFQSTGVALAFNQHHHPHGKSSNPSLMKSCANPASSVSCRSSRRALLLPGR